MVLLDGNGEPKVFQHEASYFKKGKMMDYETLHAFVTDCLVKEYKERKYEVVNTNLQEVESCDFKITMPSGRVVCCKIVLTEESFQEVIAKTDFTALFDYCRKEKAYPRLFAVSAWCFATPEGSKMINGSSFAFKVDSISLLDKDEEPTETIQSDESLIKAFADAWNNRDVAPLSSIFYSHVHYGSAFVFDEIRGRIETIAYLGDIFNRIKATNGKSQLSLCRNRETGELMLADIIKNGVFSFRCQDSRITDISLKPLERSLIDFVGLNKNDDPVSVNSNEVSVNSSKETGIKETVSTVEADNQVVTKPTEPTVSKEVVETPVVSVTVQNEGEFQTKQTELNPKSSSPVSEAPVSTMSEKTDRPVSSHEKQEKIPLFKRFNSSPIWSKMGVAVGAILLIASALTAVIVAVKQYPDYIVSYGDKLKYTFNLPNNKLAESLMNSVLSRRDKSYHLIAVPGYSEDVFTADRYYRNRELILREYPTTKVCVTNTQVRNSDDIVRSQDYIVVPNNSDPYSVKGTKLLSDWEFYGNSDARKVYSTKEIDCEKELASEVKIVDKAALIPVSNIDIIKRVGGFYENERIMSKAADYYRFELKKNKSNPEVRGMLAYSLAKNGDTEEAREEALLATKKNPKEIHALSTLALIESEEFNWGEAKKYAKKAIDYGAEDSDVYYVYCAALYKQGEKKVAQQYYNKAFELDRRNPNRHKYSEYAGAPFEVIGFHYASSNGTKTIIPCDEKLVSSKCYYIDFKLDVNILRYEEAKIGVKLLKNGKLMTGQGSKDGYTFYDEIDGSDPGQKTAYLYGWGNTSGGAWPVGTYDIEIWYNGEKVAEDSFRVY